MTENNGMPTLPLPFPFKCSAGRCTLGQSRFVTLEPATLATPTPMMLTPLSTTRARLTNRRHRRTWLVRCLQATNLRSTASRVVGVSHLRDARILLHPAFCRAIVRMVSTAAFLVSAALCVPQVPTLAGLGYGSARFSQLTNGGSVAPGLRRGGHVRSVKSSASYRDNHLRTVRSLAYPSPTPKVGGAGRGERGEWGKAVGVRGEPHALAVRRPE